MKNLLVYISKDHKFSDECEILAKVQIDNSLDLGWDINDLLFVTNFPYEYRGVKSIEVGDEHYCQGTPKSINTAIIPFLIDQDIIVDGEIYWNHDFDAYQLNTFTEDDLDLKGYDVGLTDYGWKDRWCMGSFFVKKSSRDIFELARIIIFSSIDDETTLMQLTKDPAIAKRCKRLNITYNFGMRNVESNYEKSEKPIKVVHFHPYYRFVKTLDIFMYGKNGLNTPLINDRLIRILNNHGIK